MFLDFLVKEILFSFLDFFKFFSLHVFWLFFNPILNTTVSGVWYSQYKNSALTYRHRTGQMFISI